MRIDIMTLFPDTVNSILHESIIGRAAEKGIVEINCRQIRDYTDNKQNQTDDYPYGGGFGCVMYAQPLKACLDSILSETQDLNTRVIYMSPQGKPYNQETAKRLSRDYNHLVLVCGHYEGIDERFIEKCVDEEISLGDFVLTGGEIAAMAVADSVCRLVPGVLADESCYTDESHWDGLLEYPQYTRPEVWEGLAVPQVLLNGDHDKVKKWRRIKQIERTRDKRPDMFEKLSFTDPEDIELLNIARKQAGKKKLSQVPAVRYAVPDDWPRMNEIISQARKKLKRERVDQWQGDYPAFQNFKDNFEKNECYLLTDGNIIAGFFTLSDVPEASYAGITDGKWSSDAPYMVLHRMAVADEYRGSGLSAYILSAAEEEAKKRGIKYIRVDTHRKNKSMQRLLRENGYRYRGNLIIDCEPGHDSARQGFEKKLK